MFTPGLSNCKFNHFAPTIHHLLTFFDIITRFSALIINEIGKTGGMGVLGVLGELRELRVLGQTGPMPPTPTSLPTNSKFKNSKFKII